jgi:hypothetical protein
MPDIDKISSRPSEYLAQTGVPQLMSGVVFSLLGSVVLIRHWLPKEFLAQETPQWIAIAGAATVLLGAKTLRQRFVFPRGGYVEPLPRPEFRFTLIAFFVVAAALTILASAWPGYLRSIQSRLIAPGFAVVGASICLLSGWKQKSAPLVWLGVYFLCLAPLLWWIPIPMNSYERMSCLEVGVGIPLAVAGAVRLRRFLKTNPKPAESTNE